MYQHISGSERDLVAVWNGRGLSVRAIAGKLYRSPASISRELRRNRSWVSGRYVAIAAQRRAKERSLQSRQRHPLKNPRVYSFTLEKLRQGWSPEQIAGRLTAIDHPGDPDWKVCHETIYRFIYAKQNQDKRLWEFLPRKQKSRRGQNGRSVHKARIPQRVSIHLRPIAIDLKTEFGHWEGDTVEGRKTDGDGIHSEMERLTNLYAAVKIAAVSGPQTLKAQRQIFGDMPPQARRSTTLDNGRENHLHFRLGDDLKMKTYFADPYSSWQRGGNEHHNGLLRRYLPKKTSFRDLTQDDLDEMVWEINNRPRKRLGYNTPQEAFEEQISKCCTSG